MEFLEVLNKLVEGTYIKVTGAKVKNDNGLFIVERDYSKPDERYCVVYNERCCLKIKQDGTLSKAKYNILFLGEKTPKNDPTLKVEIVTKEELKTTGKQLNQEIKAEEEKEIVTVFEKAENQEILSGSIVKFEKNLSYGTWGNKCLSRNRFYQLTLSNAGTLRVTELGKKGQYISTGENFTCSTNLKNEILSKAIVLIKKEVLKNEIKKEIEVLEVKEEIIQTIEVIEEIKQEEVQEIVPEATKEQITASEEAEVIETTISFKTAESAFKNTSFTPEVRAKSIIASSNKEIKLFLSELLKINLEKKEEIIADVKDWALKYDNKKTMWLNAMSRTASAMITGPANFPTTRNNKRNETAHNRNEELLDWMEKSKKALIKKYSPKVIPKTIFEEVEEVKKADRKGYFKSLDKESLTAKLFNYANISKENLEEVKEIALKETSLFTSKHKIHRIIESIEKKFNRISEGAANKEEIINNIKIIDSEENNRIELYFEGIPSADIRNYLKSKGFKWSPTKKAWQNYRNNQRLIEIKKYIETIGA